MVVNVLADLFGPHNSTDSRTHPPRFQNSGSTQTSMADCVDVAHRFVRLGAEALHLPVFDRPATGSLSQGLVGRCAAASGWPSGGGSGGLVGAKYGRPSPWCPLPSRCVRVPLELVSRPPERVKIRARTCWTSALLRRSRQIMPMADCG
jgi:hypothetical protein